MTRDIDHDRCSELLGGYVRGELPVAETQQVESHLVTCELCSSEQRAIAALQRPEPAPLSELERARMRRALLVEAAPAPDSALPGDPERDQRGARLFPLLGAAAVAVALMIFAYTGSGGLGGSDEAANGDMQTGQDEAREAEGAGGDGDAAREPAQALQEESVADQGKAATAAGRAAPPSPTFRASMGEVDRTELNHLGRRGLPLVLFARAFQVRDVERLRDEFVDALADAAPYARGAQIRECVAAIAPKFPNALPAYGAVGDYIDRPRREVLIVAFTWTDEPTGPLDQSMVWAWPLGTCDEVAHYSKNLIEPRR